jgi:tellurite resistance protein
MTMHPDEATLLLAFLIASADGRVDALEAQAMARELAGRLEQADPKRLERLLKLASHATHIHGPVLAMEMVQRALPTPASRAEAFRVAYQVAASDGIISTTERTRLLDLADTLGLTEEQFTRAVRGRPA